jgi:hypothetical protein
MEKQGMNDRKISEFVYYLNHMSELEKEIKTEYTQGYMAGYRAAIASLFDDFRELLDDIENGAE